MELFVHIMTKMVIMNFSLLRYEHSSDIDAYIICETDGLLGTFVGPRSQIPVPVPSAELHAKREKQQGQKSISSSGFSACTIATDVTMVNNHGLLYSHSILRACLQCTSEIIINFQRVSTELGIYVYWAFFTDFDQDTNWNLYRWNFVL